MQVMFRRLLPSLAAPLLLAACATPAPISTGAPPSIGAPGLVSAADPRAAEAGAGMLRAGGSATDAAIATMLALTVVEPQSSGIGGGGFLLQGDPDGIVTTIDGRETAPSGATPAWFTRDGQPQTYDQVVLTGLSVGVPGNLRLAAEAHRRFGKLKWRALFAPAIRLARDGFTITPRMRQFLVDEKDRAARDAAGRALFYDAAGEALPVGTSVRNQTLAATLETIAAAGPDAFYAGRAGEALAAKIRGETPKPGGMTTADLASYRAKVRDPLCGQYRAYRICGMGPPSSGATTVFAILKQIERFDLAALGPKSPVAWHLIAESQRLAYADRELYLADADFISVPAKPLMETAYLTSRGKLISAEGTMAQVAPGRPTKVVARLANGDEPQENGTSHFVAIDSAGHAVSYTSTVEGSFGSGIVFGGFYLNNELTDFSLTAEKDGKPVANRVEGGKRPRSSMAPTLVYGPDGRLVLAVGAAGGATIPAQVARAIIGVIDWKLPVQEALALPVLFAPTDTVIVEPGSALEAMIPALKALGHAEVIPRKLALKTNAAQWTGTAWHGAADPRSEGASVSQ